MEKKFIIKMIVYIVIKHSAYLRKLISKGNIACTKRRSERASAELLVNMGRFTNPSYNFLAGSEVPIKCLSARNYVVFLSPSEFNKPTTSSSFRKGSPKLTLRRKRMEFAMTRNSKEWGLRRVYSTVTSCRKRPSYVRFDKGALSGVYESNQLDLLRSYIISNKKCNNLSIIMSDPNFLISAWVRVRSNNGSQTPVLKSGTLDGIDLAWFQKTANTMRNGIFQFFPSRRTHISRPDGKKRLLTIPSPKDKIVQEAMSFLLTLVFENDFSKNSHGWVTGRGCHKALNQIKMQFAQDNWFIEGDIDQQFPSINHQVLVNLLETKIADQAFIDLIYKYLKAGYGESSNKTTRMILGISQGGVLSPILANIYMNPFDKWVESHLIPKYTIGRRKRIYPVDTKTIRSRKVTDHSIYSLQSHDRNYIRLHYVRYAGDFIMGLNGPKIYCEQIVEECRIFLFEQLKLTLNIEKTKITHSQLDSAKFLGYRVYKTKLLKMKSIAYNSKGKLSRRTTNIVLDGPIVQIVEKLKQRGYANKEGSPTRNGRFINHPLYDIVEHFKMVERGILQYYKLANNYGRVAARIHYILKYSCALTIASKMKLITLRRVFSKYGKNLNIKNKLGEIITNYPTIDYRRSKRFTTAPILDYSSLEAYVDQYDRRVQRGRKDLKGPCALCGSKKKIEIHHVRKLSKTKRKDYLSTMMVRMNRKQIPVCQKCHIKIHQGVYDGKRIQ